MMEAEAAGKSMMEAEAVRQPAEAEIMLLPAAEAEIIDLVPLLKARIFPRARSLVPYKKHYTVLRIAVKLTQSPLTLRTNTSRHAPPRRIAAPEGERKTRRIAASGRGAQASRKEATNSEIQYDDLRSLTPAQSTPQS